MKLEDQKKIMREILLGFWKVHILYHAAKEPVVGNWMLQELRHHGYEVSPGTLYPLLTRLESHGWLSCEKDTAAGPKAPKRYSLTPLGFEVLDVVKTQLKELKNELK